jgi:hypothetical protein
VLSTRSVSVDHVSPSSHATPDASRSYPDLFFFLGSPTLHRR